MVTLNGSDGSVHRDSRESSHNVSHGSHTHDTPYITHPSSLYGEKNSSHPNAASSTVAIKVKWWCSAQKKGQQWPKLTAGRKKKAKNLANPYKSILKCNKNPGYHRSAPAEPR
ncbi:unnamed protein product [Ilex paraguariensis]|uniref:Uncharacterized protein n=1 Tax=Ilex paraguariensis TaxID=185542 RepID=A0ABC8UKQ3_9AQUA